MNRRIGIVMDPISEINIEKDSSFAMLLAAQNRGWSLFYMEQQDLFLYQGYASAEMRSLTVTEDDDNDWFELSNTQTLPLATLEVILMRKNPPFNIEYIYSTYLLEQAQAKGVLVVNHPQSLRDANEKLYTAWFPQCCPPTLVTHKKHLIHDFQRRYDDIIIKPLDGMGGTSIFRIKSSDPNIIVIIDTLTAHGQKTVMAQKYISEIKEGDKRILIVDGKPVPYALARTPPKGDTRGNLAIGAIAEGRPLTKHDYWICEQVGPTLSKKALLFVGLDIIGDYLTEINITSPTCIRELDKQFNLNIADDIMNIIERQLS